MTEEERQEKAEKLRKLMQRGILQEFLADEYLVRNHSPLLGQEMQGDILNRKCRFSPGNGTQYVLQLQKIAVLRRGEGDSRKHYRLLWWVSNTFTGFSFGGPDIHIDYLIEKMRMKNKKADAYCIGRWLNDNFGGISVGGLKRPDWGRYDIGEYQKDFAR